MNENMSKAYAEIDCILKLLQSDFVERIPVKLKVFFQEKKDKEYKVNINPNISLENQQLLPETIGILALLKLSYWCENEKEKQELLKLFNNNEIEYQSKLENRYSSKNLFNNKKQDTQISVISEKSSLKDKILKFIYKVLKKEYKLTK